MYIHIYHLYKLYVYNTHTYMYLCFNSHTYRISYIYEINAHIYNLILIYTICRLVCDTNFGMKPDTKWV